MVVAAAGVVCCGASICGAAVSNSAACVFFRANILRLLVIADDILVLSVYDAYCGGVGKCRFYLFTRKYLVDSVATTLDWRKSG